MAKVLRLHKGAADTIGNWDTSVKIGAKAINSIADPIGANDKYEITSIPSPFARMDLVKRAFKIVAESSLEGKTAYHKLVSDCLDVGQIFFNIEKYREKIEIIVWDKKNCLAELSESDYEEFVFTHSKPVVEGKYILFIDTFFGTHPDDFFIYPKFRSILV